MEHRFGFVQDMLDVKVLVLFVLARVERPVSLNKIYELCYQDDRLSYFDLCQAIPQMVETGHIHQLEENLFEITDTGREVCAVMEDTVAYPVAQRAKAAAEKFNRDARRSNFLRTEVRTREDSPEVTVHMELMDENSQLMTLELLAPDLSQGRRMERAFREKAERIYLSVMEYFMDSKNER